MSTDPRREPTTNKRTDTRKIQLDEPVSFIGVTYIHTDERLCIETEMTQKQLHHQSPS